MVYVLILDTHRQILSFIGYALDPTIDGTAEEGKSLVGSVETAEEKGAKTVFEHTPIRPLDKRKRKKNDNPEDVTGFLGPWGGFIDEQRIVKPTEEEAAELEEILAKRNKRGKQTDDKPIEERTVLHSKYPFSMHFSLEEILVISSQNILCLQSKTALIIKEGHSFMHLKMLVLI